MEELIKSLIDISISICATHPKDNTELVDRVYDYMVAHFAIDTCRNEIEDALENNTAARLFYSYGHSSPVNIRKPNMIKSLLRKLWLYCSLIQLKDIPDYHKVKNLCQNAFNQESITDKGLSPSYFGLFELTSELYKDKENLKGTTVSFYPFLNEIIDAINEYREYFKSVGMDYLWDIYQVADAQCSVEQNESKDISEVIDSRETCDQERSISNVKLEDTDTTETNKIIEGSLTDYKLLSDVEEKIKSLRSRNVYLEKINHEKDIKLDFAKKDAIREVLQSLLSEKYGYPLNELYLIQKDSESQDKVKRAVSNLFMALEELNVRLVKEKLVGSTLIIDESNAGQFNLMKGDDLRQGDSVAVKYPGYRLGQEVIVRPIVQKRGDINE